MSDEKFNLNLGEEVKARVQAKYLEVMEQREEIMRAFVAKYGCQPEEMVQIEWRRNTHSEWPNKTAEMLWFVVYKDHCILCAKCRGVIAEGQVKEIEND